jgi:hyperosmotically inducible periplasmic protein
MKIMNVTMIMVACAILTVTGMPVCGSDLDAGIEASAENLYVFRAFLKDDDVTITSEDGVVTLTGQVANEHRRLLAAEAVANLDGVKSVNNELELKGETPEEYSDAWIAMHVKSVLLFHKSVSGLSTEVSVEDGIVTLSGEADNKAQKQLAAEYAKDVEGVKDVRNEMTIATMPKMENKTIGERIDDASITSQVKMSLLFHRSTRAFKTQVKTNDGVVTVSGMAKNSAEKELVSKLVMDINGVTDVNNMMTIKNPETY